MFYVLLVSHREFAPGLHTAVKMIAGDNPNVMSAGLKDGMGADEMAVEVARLVEKITPEDRLVVLADLIIGSHVLVEADLAICISKNISSHRQALGFGQN